MQLISVFRLTPIRNETGKIYKWQEDVVRLNPQNIQSATYQPNLNKVVVVLTNGNEMILAESLEELEGKVEKATYLQVQVGKLVISDRAFHWLTFSVLLSLLTLLTLQLFRVFG